MAKWRIECICPECGKHFEREGFEQNRRLADSKAEWIANHPGICPECYRKSLIKEAEEIVASNGLTLPEITGKSDKQVKYAFDLRVRTILGSKSIFKNFKDVNMEIIKEAYEKGKKSRSFSPVIRAIACIVENDAHSLIDVIR